MNSTIALKLYAFGINKLHDPNWSGIQLFDKLKQHVRQRIEPKNMLYATIKNGLLFHIGRWVFEDYLESEYRFEEYLEIEGEYLLWYSEDYIEFLLDVGINSSDVLVKKSVGLLDTCSILYEEDEEVYYRQINKYCIAIKKLLVKLSITYETQIKAVKNSYSQDFAERIFHDRTLCEFISNLIVLIGFDGTDKEDENPKQWIMRKNIPNWAKKAIIARDRGKCAQCGRDLVQELQENMHFDHIAALYQGGTNDISNFQLLCEKCNLKKSKQKIHVMTSIPKYLQFKQTADS